MDIPYDIHILPEAEQDLLEIDEYLSQFYPSTPAKFFKELDKRLLQLTQFPFAYPVYPDSNNYRKAIVSDYLILYKIIEEARIVQIHAVWHGSMNIREHIKKLH